MSRRRRRERDVLEVGRTGLASRLEERKDLRRGTRKSRSTSFGEQDDVVKQRPDVGPWLVDRDDDRAPVRSEVAQRLHDVLSGEGIEACRVTRVSADCRE